MRHHWPPHALIALLQLMVSGSASGRWGQTSDPKSAKFCKFGLLTVNISLSVAILVYLKDWPLFAKQTMLLPCYPATLPPCLLCLDRMQNFQCHNPWSGDQWRCWPKEPDCSTKICQVLERNPKLLGVQASQKMNFQKCLLSCYSQILTKTIAEESLHPKSS